MPTKMEITLSEMKMKIQYLGTAASEGWPAMFCDCEICREAEKRGGKDHRFRSCAKVDNDILLDCSPDIYGAVHKLGASLRGIRHVAITHGHNDHFNVHQLHWYAPNFNHTPPTAALKIYGSTGVRQLFDKQEELWNDQYAVDWLEFVEINSFETARIDEHTTLTALPALHAREGEGAQTLLLERDGKRILYLHDTAEVVDAIYDFLRGKHIDMVSLDATVGPKELKDGKGHMNFKRDLLAFNRMKEAGMADAATTLVVNHICIHACHDKETGRMYFHDDMQKMMSPHGVVVSYDGLELEI